jgi:hypothetical protein
MNTPAHLIFGAAAFARPDAWKVTTAALIGALLPDLSLYILCIWHLFILGTSPDVVFGELYFSDAWVRIFRVDNSFLLWGIALGLAIWRRSQWAIALCGAALLHIAFDFPLHHDDGRPHFWPLTMWVFDSPFSYWDRAAHAGIIGPLEMAISLILCGVLWFRFQTVLARAVILLAAATQLAPVFVWVFVFDRAG